jgi:hypothetical protein
LFGFVWLEKYHSRDLPNFCVFTQAGSSTEVDLRDVRFNPISGLKADIAVGQLRANNRHQLVCASIRSTLGQLCRPKVIAGHLSF